MQPGQGVYLDELRPAAFVAAQVEAARVAAAEYPPDAQGDVLDVGHQRVVGRLHEPVAHQGFKVFLVVVGIDLLFGGGQQQNLHGADHFRLAAGSDDARS